MLIFLFVLIILALALEAFSLREGIKNVSFQYKPSVDRAEPGEEIKIVTSVSNHGWLPISYLRASIAYPVDALLPSGLDMQEQRFTRSVSSVFRLWGRQRVRRTMSISLAKRGVHLFDGAFLVRGDFLGFNETGRRYDSRHEVLIYPAPADSAGLRDALGSYCGDVIARRHLIRDPIITMGVREYTGREAMKTISWSQTARRGELMVREFDYTRDMSCTVLLATNGLGPLENDLLDKCCSVARTVCEELTAKGVNIDLYTNAPLWGFSNRDIWSAGASPGRMGDVLETLARVYAAARCPAEELVGVSTRAAGVGTAFVLIAPYNNAKIQDALRAIHDTTGMDALLLCVSEMEV